MPDARIVIHASYVGVTPSDIFVEAFFKAMVDEGGSFDIAGLSLPYSQQPWRLNEYSADCWFQRLQEKTDYTGRANGDSGTQVLESYDLFNADKSSRPAIREFNLPPR